MIISMNLDISLVIHKIKSKYKNLTSSLILHEPPIERTNELNAPGMRSGIL